MGMSMGPSTYGPFLAVGTTVVTATPALLCNLMLHPGSAAATLTVYDNSTTGSGNIIAQLQGVANGATVLFPFDDSPPQASKGLTCVVSGTGAQAQIYYQPIFI